MKNNTIRSFARMTMVGAVALLACSAAQATVMSGSSSGYGASADLSALRGLVDVTIDPIPEAAGTAPAPYAVDRALLGLDAGVRGILSASSGLLNTSAASDVDAMPGERFASARTSVDDLAVNVLLAGLGLSSETLASTAMVSGDYGALSAAGSTTLENARLDVLGQSIALAINPQANTEVLADLLNPLGISLLLNEQILGGNGVDSQSLTVNALHLSFDDFALAGLGLLNGDLIVSQAYAALTARPDAANDVAEPSGMVLLLFFGLGLLGIVAGKRRTFAGRGDVLAV